MFSDLVFRLRSLLRRGTVENELDDELRFHLDQQVEKYMQGASRARKHCGELASNSVDSASERGLPGIARHHALRNDDSGYSLRLAADAKNPCIHCHCAIDACLGNRRECRDLYLDERRAPEESSCR
jgi:hypothetical protein